MNVYLTFTFRINITDLDDAFTIGNFSGHVASYHLNVSQREMFDIEMRSLLVYQ